MTTLGAVVAGSRTSEASIDGALARLDAVVEVCRARASRVGYFAVVCRRMCRALAGRISEEAFDDADRLDRFAGLIVRPYLDALAAFERDEEPPRSWLVCFSLADGGEATILQHVITGTNAQVNLDLAVAAAQLVRGGSIADVEADFGRVAAIIGEELERVQGAVAPFSPLVGCLRAVADGPGGEVLRFSLPVAVEEAWRRAVLLSALPMGRWPATTDSIDRATAVLGRTVAQPGGALHHAVEVVRHAETETEDVPAVIDALAGPGGSER